MCVCVCVCASTPVEVLDAVDLGGGVHGEGHSVQAAVAHHAGEAAWVVGLAHGPQDAVQDGLGALGASLQRTLKCTDTRGERETHTGEKGICLPLKP